MGPNSPLCPWGAPFCPGQLTTPFSPPLSLTFPKSFAKNKRSKRKNVTQHPISHTQDKRIAVTVLPPALPAPLPS